MRQTKKVKVPDAIRTNVSVQGECIGVKLKQRGNNDDHVMIQMLVEDDGMWYEKGFTVSSHWLDETIRVLKTARKMLRHSAKPDLDNNGRQYGYRFK